jgi:hypothetical protein
VRIEWGDGRWRHSYVLVYAAIIIEMGVVVRSGRLSGSDLCYSRDHPGLLRYHEDFLDGRSNVVSWKEASETICM